MRRIVALNLAIALLISMCCVLYGCSSGSSNKTHNNASSADYDALLCSGTTENGDTYMLVGSQTENYSGVDIKIGVIKNGEWLIPLNSNSGFLGDDGTFHVKATSGYVESFETVDLYSASSAFTFMDNGAFMMESYTHQTLGYSKAEYIFLSCVQKDYITVDRSICDLPSIDKGLFNSGFTDNGKLVGYHYDNINGRYAWYILDIDRLELKQIADDMKCYPVGDLSDGLFLASNDCFYNTKAQKVIDLSEYNIAHSNIMFIDGRCMVDIKNNVGHSYWIIIDKQGNILQEGKS